jgi:hypothetical protein
MRPSASIITSGALAPRRSADLQHAWLDAADDAYEAYVAWCRAGRAEAPDAFAVYQAALDREEAAARALELQLRTLRPALSLDPPRR